MAQIFVNLPVPSANGSGAAVDVSSMGPLKSMMVSGGAECVVVVEMSNDPAAINWAPVWVSQQAGGVMNVELAAHWMRATVQQYKSGTPQVDVGGTNEGASFTQLVAPAASGGGAAVDVSLLGIFRTLHVGGDFRGSLQVEVSEDGTSNWSTLLSFNNPGQQSVISAAHHMRIRRNGVPDVNPGLPSIYMGTADPVSGDRGVGISAGTQSVDTGTVKFADSNGISFGMSASSQVTASMDAFRSMVALGGTATGGTLSFVNTNGVTFGIAGGQLTASVQTAGGTATGVAISASTQIATTGAVIFAASNGISFGLNAQTLTATYQALRTISAAGGSVTNGQLSISNGSGVSFGIAAGVLTASVFVPALQRTAGFTATGGETRATVTFTPAAASSNYGVFGQLAGVASAFQFDIASSLQSVSAFVVEPTASMVSGDALKFFLFISS